MHRVMKKKANTAKCGHKDEENRRGRRVLKRGKIREKIMKMKEKRRKKEDRKEDERRKQNKRRKRRREEEKIKKN